MPIHGDRLDKPTYRILRTINHTGVAEVHLSEHLVFGERTVQKTFDVFGLEDSIAYQEPQLLRQIKHPNIVPVFDAQPDPDHEDAITMVMPFYEGGSVSDALMEGQRFSLVHAAGLGAEIFTALHHLHVHHGYLHRDNKPGNVFLSGDRRTAYVGDFGSVGKMDEHGETGSVETTPLYRPPEAGPKTGRMTVRSDVYSAGMVLHELVTGRFPYEILDTEILRVERRLAAGQRSIPDRYFASFAPHVPDELRRVITKATAKRPQDRWSHAGAVARALFSLQRRMVDWRHIDGDELDGRWEGFWPPQVPPARQRQVEIESSIVKGRRRLVARRLGTSGRWSRFAAFPDIRGLAPADAASVHDFFRLTEARLRVVD
ncbi:MAG TPA: serine/threonine-protein kinase [Candidatus Sulfotelmatobacter sp.]|nr:serine/threonine-protein kinase [Candidatus Sulfotelmatobacter sp.]